MESIHTETDPQPARRTKRPGLTPRSRLHFRIKDIVVMLTDRYGPRLPDDDDARDYFRPLIQHALLIGPERARDLVAKLMPHFDEELDTVGAYWWGDDELGVHLDFTDADRTRLKITTIGGCDCLRDARLKRRRRKRRAADRDRRREAGAVPRKQSAESLRPWEAEGISRPTYYRRRKAARETGETVSRPAIFTESGGRETVSAGSVPAPAGPWGPTGEIDRKKKVARQWTEVSALPVPAPGTVLADRGIAREGRDCQPPWVDIPILTLANIEADLRAGAGR